MSRGDGAGAPANGVGRRTLLRAAVGVGGLAVAGAGVGVAMAEDLLPGGVRLRRALGLTGPDGALPPTAAAGSVSVEKFRSEARGATVQLITMLPPGAAHPGDLPVCLALHGRGADAQTMVDTGLPQFLGEAVAAGVPPFALVAVDGGDATYWHRTGSDDPQKMLLDEVPGRLARQGLRTPAGAMGISMGGSGSLRYARNRGGGFGPVALLSPALFRTWPDARAVEVFRDEDDWREHEPLLHLDEPHGSPLGVWCGTEDPFCDAARGLAPGAAQAHFPRGEHTAGFWRRVLPDTMTFLGNALAGLPA